MEHQHKRIVKTPSVEAIPPRYKPLAFLGHGAFGEVRKVTDRNTGRMLALKNTKASKDGFTITSSFNEVIQLARLNEFDEQGFVVKLIKTEMYKGNRFMALELLQDFRSWMNRHHSKGVPLSVTKIVCRRLFSAMCFLKEQNVIHGDIKPNNVLMATDDPDSLKLCDFGLARRLYVTGQMEHFPSHLGCVRFRPPEALFGYPSDYAADMWSMGIFLFYIVTKTCVFSSKRSKDLVSEMLLMFGVPPTRLLEAGLTSNDYFFVRGTGENAVYVPKHCPGTGWKTPLGARQLLPRISKLTAVPGCPHTAFTTAHFHNLVRRLLIYDPATRLNPEQALDHPFVR